MIGWFAHSPERSALRESRTGATPMQYLFGMRVVDVDGHRLGIAKASLRAIVLLAMVALTLAWFDVAGRGLTIVLATAGCLLAVLAALMANRQGGHDLAAGSIVVNKRMLRSAELARGYFELFPVDSDSGIEWRCRVHGEIERRYLPGLCRS